MFCLDFSSIAGFVVHVSENPPNAGFTAVGFRNGLASPYEIKGFAAGTAKNGDF